MSHDLNDPPAILHVDPQQLSLDIPYLDPSSEDFFESLFTANTSEFGPALTHSDNLPSSGQEDFSGWGLAPAVPCIQCTSTGQHCQRTPTSLFNEPCAPCGALGSPCSFSNITSSVTDEIPLLSDTNPSLTPSDTPDAVSQPATKSATETPPAKIGTRFSRESSKHLKRWLALHESYPYPSKNEMVILQQQTGLSKTQIQNWLSNTRRRNRNRGNSQAASPYQYPRVSGTEPIEIPRRPGTPAIRHGSNYQNMNPLERWVDSPPESEPATATAIANAVASARPSSSSKTPSHSQSSSLQADKFQDTGPSSHFDDGSSRSLRDSSASSRGDSSGSSFASSFSHSSGGSLRNLTPFAHRTPRRRRRLKKSAPKRSLAVIEQQRYQCTFCTETFKTKHDWQRHEKALHISLDRWICCPFGPRMVNPETGQTCCVFCGEVEPSEAHLETHNPTSCQERSFYRKDHLTQHLRLVHNSGLVDWVAKAWKTPVPELHSRCGFCGIDLETWTDRVEHLADHFKMGKTMADWSGDWGFDDVIGNSLENAIPPCEYSDYRKGTMLISVKDLVHVERTSPYPFQASGVPPESPRSAYELLTLELSFFVQNYHHNNGHLPEDSAMQLEACRIIFASEALLLEEDPYWDTSWLRDLLTSNDTITQCARVMPIRRPAECRLRSLDIRGKGFLFERCPLEAELRDYVFSAQETGMDVIQDKTLQEECYKIISRIEGALASTQDDFVFKWLVRLIWSSTNWIVGFRKRRGLPASERVTSPPKAFMAPDPQSGFWDSHSLDVELGDYQHGSDGSAMPCSSVTPELVVPQQPPQNQNGDTLYSPSKTAPIGILQYQRPTWLKQGIFILDDPNFHRWLGRELGRWVAATMSPNNPTSHIPSDEEIQHHARFLLYNE